ncbi:hypothetical protein Hdeb2414_s0752g00943251 [Helianthus debilis subsp. tardiflorus]
MIMFSVYFFEVWCIDIWHMFSNLIGCGFKVVYSIGCYPYLKEKISVFSVFSRAYSLF